MGMKLSKKWQRSLTKRYDRVVRLVGLPHLAVCNEDFERSIRCWRDDSAEDRLRYEYDLTPSDVVLDLGGFQGSWSAEIFARYRVCIHIFEPVPDYYRAICDRFARNEQIHVYRYGLSGTTRSQSLSLEGDASSEWRQSNSSVEVAMRDVSEFLEQSDFREIALCKINIEGGEYELLERLLDTQNIERFRNLQIQFHTFVPHATKRMEAIQRRLQQTHELTYQYRFVWENWRRLSAAAAA